MKMLEHFFTYDGERGIARCKCGVTKHSVLNARELRAFGNAHLDAVRVGMAHDAAHLQNELDALDAGSLWSSHQRELVWQRLTLLLRVIPDQKGGR